MPFTPLERRCGSSRGNARPCGAPRARRKVQAPPPTPLLRRPQKNSPCPMLPGVSSPVIACRRRAAGTFLHAQACAGQRQLCLNARTRVILLAD